jgi:hypothetical protein
MKAMSWISMAAILCAGLLVVDDAMAAGKKKFRKRSEISTEERAKIYKWALNKCRAKHGARLHHVEIEYAYGRYICFVEG